jgi:serine/threonine-protein kinase
MSSSHVTPTLAQGALVAGKYRLQRLLGEGAMGVVWSARNELTSGQVALKLIVAPGAELRLRLLREAQACCQIQHKNVIQIHDVGQMDSGDPFLVMELLSGETLADLLERKRRLNQREAAVIGRDVARALSAAHDKGIVHRDLKPANIFLHNQPGEDARVVKVLDFGVSKNLLAADGLQTMMGGAIGSPSYMSPEQARGARDIDARADIWSLGVLLFEMVTGERPFLGEAREVIESILEGEIPVVSRRVRGLDPGLERLISGCLTRDREQRMWPIADVAAALEPFTEGVPRSTIPTLTAVWGAAPTPPSSRPRAPAAPLAPEAESDAETQKLEPATLATLATPAVRPVLRAAMPSALPYDPTVRMFSTPHLPPVPVETRAARANGTQAPILPATGDGRAPPAIPLLPPPLPSPLPLPLSPREASQSATLSDERPSKRGELLFARAFVGLLVAAVVVLLAFTHRAPASATVTPETAAAVVEAMPVGDRSPAPLGPSTAVVEEMAALAHPIAPAPPAPVAPPATAKIAAPIAPRPRPRAAMPKPLPSCGRFVKTGCDAPASKP